MFTHQNYFAKIIKSSGTVYYANEIYTPYTFFFCRHNFIVRLRIIVHWVLRVLIGITMHNILDLTQFPVCLKENEHFKYIPK